jgi:hypothetical protein
MPNYNRINKNIGICTAAGFRTKPAIAVAWSFRLFARICEFGKMKNIYFFQMLTKMSKVYFQKAGRL